MVTVWGDDIWKGDHDMYSEHSISRINLVLTRILLLHSKFLRILILTNSTYGKIVKSSILLNVEHTIYGQFYFEIFFWPAILVPL